MSGLALGVGTLENLQNGLHGYLSQNVLTKIKPHKFQTIDSDIVDALIGGRLYLL